MLSLIVNKSFCICKEQRHEKAIGCAFKISVSAATSFFKDFCQDTKVICEVEMVITLIC